MPVTPAIVVSSSRPPAAIARAARCVSGEQQQHALPAQAAGEEGDERPRRAIGPVQVLEDQRQRLGFAEHVEQLEQRLEQP